MKEAIFIGVLSLMQGFNLWVLSDLRGRMGRLEDYFINHIRSHTHRG